ncbi:DUF3027 domain-containing protein [Arthrobacter crystallopoietes]|uniref:DUF3027 domain-containing protein n=1 Tax=Crystallibacter crystallopoietes TaxID=37928 RepID=UPI001F1F6BDA|nr:DUF3027 domain-containing protein [Arthrobacter crystallopoietes]
MEPTVDTAAESPAPVRRRPAAKRPAKLDALLAAAVDRARQGVLEMAPAEQVGDHVGVVAEAERLVVHRFESKLPGYIGWQWFASLARAPRSKEITVCEIGLLPSEKSLLAPDWVPWAERVRPEEAAAEAESIADENNDGENNDGAGQAADEAVNDADGAAEAGRVGEAAAPAAVDGSADQASADPDRSTPATSEASTPDSATSENTDSADAVLEPSSSETSADEPVADELGSDAATAEANAEAAEAGPETAGVHLEAPETTPYPEATA